MKRCFLMVLLVSAGFLPAGEADWPRFRGPGQDGIIAPDGLFSDGYGLDVSWKKEIGSGYSSFSVADGIAVVMFSDGSRDVAIGLSVASGRELWRYDIAETYKGHDGSHDGTIATPAIDDGVVYGLAAFGHLFALSLKTGAPVWRKHLVDDFAGKAPDYGFSASPLVVGDHLIVPTNSEGGSVCALDKKTGALAWKTGDDTIAYQSPILATLMGQEQIVMAGNTSVMGIDPKKGTVLWTYAHEGDNESLNPVVIGEDRLFLNHTYNGGKMVQISRKDAALTFETLWENNELRNSYNVPVYRDGHLYGYSGRFLACIDAGTGARVWKSRPPGDGFAILVSDHLVLVTKAGTIHLADATPEGYREKASLEVFDSLGWSPPSFAGGKIFVRNLTEIAAVDIGGSATLLADDAEPAGILPKTRFAAFVASVRNAEDKKAAIDAYLGKISRFPIIEDNRFVHVVHRGDAKDVAISGDMFTSGQEQVMNRVEGTDLRFFSFELAPDAHIAYQMTIDFGQAGADPMNPAQSGGFQGETYSLIAMPEHTDSDHLSEPEQRGTVEELTIDSKLTEATRKVWVYLPNGYADNSQRFPVAYFGYGRHAHEQGLVTTTLDNQIGKTIAPMIAVFVDLHPEKGFGEMGGENGEAYMRYLVEELVPMIDKKYRTRTEAQDRAAIGYSSAGFAALSLGARYPSVFGKVAVQSANLQPPRGDRVRELLEASEGAPGLVVMEWGRYDLRNGEDIDFAGANATLAEQLSAAGLSVERQELSLGYGWGNWRTRTDDVLAKVFPMGTM